MPAIAHALYHAVEVVKGMEEQRDRIKKGSAWIRAELEKLGYQVPSSQSHIIPVIARDEKQAIDYSLFLQQQGFDIRAIRPPTVRQSRLRLSIHSCHSDLELKELSQAFSRMRSLS